MSEHYIEAEELATWAIARAAEQAAHEPPDMYSICSLPFLEAECGWIGTGLIWTGYSQRDIEEITQRIARYVAMSLAVAGLLRPAPGVDP